MRVQGQGTGYRVQGIGYRIGCGVKQFLDLARRRSRRRRSLENRFPWRSGLVLVVVVGFRV